MHEIVMRAPGKNALSASLMSWLVSELEAAAGKPVLLRGEDGAFSAGLNLKEIGSLDAQGMQRFLGLLEEMLDALYTYPGPTVACIDGHAIAGGCILALACDVRIVSAQPLLRIGLNETAIGLRFPPKAMAIAKQRISPHALERVVLSAGLYSPTQALRLGLVDEVVPDALASSRAELARLAAFPREAYARNKEALRAGVLDVSEAEARRFREEVVPLWTAAETKARLSSLLKK
jgi:enoyl-CoA hydratase/carnithine racemase